MSSVTLRILSLWVILFSISAMGKHILPSSSLTLPIVAASPAPIDPGLASVITSNMNLNCGQSCQTAKGTKQLVTFTLERDACVF
ncbi:uncharacterized protein BJ212DRAFT_1260690 [Suillus subaureus]|uniref:Uncharacterized protein n=1 Tax=Suillus subaureus TaxID=48587 RepID=A0A9P7EKZ0_9AGAM|nr:uncharacterized protein BJ212DRAFT_1260690 [Suillus subaureus]KAG1824432.1 hypothetical protein BJ212DRAFT_1260690 [Suillus subaureus]